MLTELNVGGCEPFIHGRVEGTQSALHICRENHKRTFRTEECINIVQVDFYPSLLLCATPSMARNITLITLSMADTHQPVLH